ncbi:anti-sigma factor [Mesonia aestuariivivens]|uniref:Anti-sigma factor n=1 Tax=Mesonia aestuariivivens TaxID=2796128 RepID=A0ABS6W1K6_9FLAO|nr:anti-sigma factor [Mesonia aestuariivivens]MBW2961427.1 anti-sigma factor [Mesonia aestuariivivens]
MNLNEYISSGILELYVYGALPEQESIAVTTELKKHPEILKEVEEIENALSQLSTAAAPYNPEALLFSIQQKITNKTNTATVREHPASQKKNNLVLYISWAASIALLIGLISVINQRNKLRENINAVSANNVQLEEQIDDAQNNAKKTKELLNVFRNKDIISVPLAGQDVAPTAYAAIHWDEKNKQVYVDAKDLPKPPQGKEYQVWSLTLEPLTPTSIGLLSNFNEDENKIFILENPNSSQAFGITLEPKGGSKTPTMEQLYTLGVIKNS